MLRKNSTKNLKQSIERNCSDIQFLIVDNEEVTCPNTTTMEEILSLLFKKKKKMEQLKNVEENIYSSAVAICKEPEECTYNTSWPPLCNELDMDCFPVFPSLRKFCLLLFAMKQRQIMTKQKELYHRCLKSYFMLFIRERN